MVENDKIVSVKLHGQEVGRVYWDTRGRRAVFYYNPEFVAHGPDLAPLTAPINAYVANDEPVMGNRDAFCQGLPPFLADSLPDRWGNLVFDRWAQQNNIPKGSLTPVDRLALLGDRGMGALEFQALTGSAVEPVPVEVGKLHGLTKRLLGGQREPELDAGECELLQQLFDLGIEAGGSHPKIVVAIDTDTDMVWPGYVQPRENLSFHILKFAENCDYPNVRMEMVYYEMALAAGINVMPSRLIEAAGVSHFLTVRYDRRRGEKIHTQTLAAMCPEASSYEDMFMTCRRLDLAANELVELYRRMVFNVLAGNVDDHSKNFAFMLERNGRWHLAPAYDLNFSTNMDWAPGENKHALSICGKTSGITIADLLFFGKANSIKKAHDIVNTVAAAVSKFYIYACKYGVSAYWRDRIEHHLSLLVPVDVALTMQHHQPTTVEPYTTPDGLRVSHVSLEETPRHHFRLSACINGQQYQYEIVRKSETARLIEADGCCKIPEYKVKRLIQRYLCPMVKTDTQEQIADF